MILYLDIIPNKKNILFYFYKLNLQISFFKSHNLGTENITLSINFIYKLFYCKHSMTIYLAVFKIAYFRNYAIITLYILKRRNCYLTIENIFSNHVQRNDLQLF